jgi:hypothetical protein
LEVLESSDRQYSPVQQAQLRRSIAVLTQVTISYNTCAAISNNALQKLTTLIMKEIIDLNPFKEEKYDSEQPKPVDSSKLKPVDKYITSIIGESMNEENLSCTSLTYMAWL